MVPVACSEGSRSSYCACGRLKPHPNAKPVCEARDTADPALLEQRLEDITSERLKLAARIGELAAEASDVRDKIGALKRTKTDP